MEAKIRFRFNTLTGEVEAFEVEQASALPAAEHERRHDQLAAEVGAVLELHPRVTELPATAAPQGTEPSAPEDEAQAAGQGPTRRPQTLAKESDEAPNG